MTLSRRKMLLASMAGLGVAGAIAVEAWRRSGKQYPPTPYDDLLGQLPDQEGAKIVGRAFLAQHTGFVPELAAQHLRAHVRGRQLSAVLADEIAAGQFAVAGGWIMPATLLGICALAAMSQAQPPGGGGGGGAGGGGALGSTH